MSYVYEAWGWENAEGDWIDGDPISPDLTYGLYVRVYDPDNPEDEHWGWVYTIDTLDDWDDWNALVAVVYGDHGLELTA